MTEPTGWITKNGKRIPLRGGGGKAGPVVVAGLVALGALGYGGAGGGLGAAGSGGVGSSAGQSVAVRKVDGGKAARKGDADGAWRRMGMRGLKKSAKQHADCVLASFGEVREFLVRTPCASLDRMLYAVGDDAGNSAVISVAWVGFRSRRDAVAFQDVIDVHGSGDITPLGGVLLDMADIAFTGHHYDSELNRTDVAVAETEVASGHVDRDLLIALAQVASQLPRP